MDHTNFWWEFTGRVGAPMFAATVVGCLLSDGFEALHGILLGTALVLMGLAHWHEHHQKRGSS